MAEQSYYSFNKNFNRNKNMARLLPPEKTPEKGTWTRSHVAQEKH